MKAWMQWFIVLWRTIPTYYPLHTPSNFSQEINVDLAQNAGVYGRLQLQVKIAHFSNFFFVEHKSVLR